MITQADGSIIHSTPRSSGGHRMTRATNVPISSLVGDMRTTVYFLREDTESETMIRAYFQLGRCRVKGFFAMNRSGFWTFDHSYF